MLKIVLQGGPYVKCMSNKHYRLAAILIAADSVYDIALGRVIKGTSRQSQSLRRVGDNAVQYRVVK